MVAHVNAPDYQQNADDPATLSSFWIQDILKKELGFKGTVITDAMGMGGIVKNYSDSYALIATLKAGSDIIIQNNQMKKSIDLIEQAVLDGIISEDRINASAYKILKMKEKVGIHKTSLITQAQTHTLMGENQI